MTYSVNIGAASGPVFIPAKYLNRHGLITGATGTGKSVSVINLAESLTRIGVPVLITDVKGDLSGMAAPSTASPPTTAVTWYPESSDVRFYDVYQENGYPLQTSIKTLGPAIMARALGLSDVQAGVLEICFAVARAEAMPLDTLDNLRSVASYCAENRETVGRRYGLVTPSSVAAIGRSILRLESGGGAAFFSDTPSDIRELLRVNPPGAGLVSMLDCTRLIRDPRLYGAVMLWLLSTLADVLPERGDADKPVFCLFIDEAHLVFKNGSPELIDTVDQTVRLIRSKGVGVFFASQSPCDIPDGIAAMLHLRIQHALRAATPAQRNVIRAAAESLPCPLGFRAIDVISNLKPGTALVSYMDESGSMTPADVVAISLPRCRLSPLSDTERAAHIPRPATVAPVDDTPAPRVGFLRSLLHSVGVFV